MGFPPKFITRSSRDTGGPDRGAGVGSLRTGEAGDPGGGPVRSGGAREVPGGGQAHRGRRGRERGSPSRQGRLRRGADHVRRTGVGGDAPPGRDYGARPRRRRLGPGGGGTRNGGLGGRGRRRVWGSGLRRPRLPCRGWAVLSTQPADRPVRDLPSRRRDRHTSGGRQHRRHQKHFLPRGPEPGRSSLQGGHEPLPRPPGPLLRAERREAWSHSATSEAASSP